MTHAPRRPRLHRLLRRRLLLAAPLGGLGLLGGCASLGLADPAGAPRGGLAPPEESRVERLADALNPFPDPIVYAVSFEFAEGDAPEDLLEILRGASETVARQRGDAPEEIALRRRARADEDRLTRALRSEGYFEGRVVADVAPARDADAGETEDAAENTAGDSVENRAQTGAENGAEDAADPDLPRVAFQVARGPRFTLERFDIRIETPPGSRPVDPTTPPETGGPARSADILDAENRALETLRANGRPYAALGPRDAVADFETKTLRVESRIAAGPEVAFGPVRIDGAERVAPDFIEGYAAELEGAPASLPALRRVERALAATRLFRAAQATLPEPAPARDGVVRPTLTLVEAPPRSVGGGLRFNTADGPGASAFWEHRNLFGRAERLRVATTAALELQDLDLDFRKPRFRDPDQALLAEARLARDDNEAFEGLSAEARVGLERRLSDRWSATLGLSGEAAEIDEGDGAGPEFSYLLGVPATLSYDGSDDLLNPTRGARAAVSATPWGGATDGVGVGFLALSASGSAYQRLDPKARFVAAVRARAETLTGASLGDVPANRRAYAGGGGSVRGFGARLIGPLDDEDEPIGGLTAYDAGVELRIAATPTIGVVPFVEAGAVARDAFDLGLEDLVYGVGLGLRYQSPLGPLRVDLATPLDPREVDEPVQLYVGVGQAF